MTTDGTSAGSSEVPADRDRDSTAAEIEQWEREDVFADSNEIGSEAFPRLWNMSAGFLMRAIVRPVTPDPPEYLTIAMPSPRHDDDESLRRSLAIHKWNSLWEAAQFRRRFLGDDEELPPELERIADRGDINVMFVPRTQSRYYEYAPLYHLLSRKTCERYGLPLLARGCWPFALDYAQTSRYLPGDFSERLARAWAATVWSHLNSGSPVRAFTADDPIRLLAHNLDYWIPPATHVIQNTLRELPLVPGKGQLPDHVELSDGSTLDGAVPGWPRMGGDLWRGTDEAAEFVAATVEQADATGALSAIIDAVRSHRVEDDFSDFWSNARIDFERKLYRTRNKVSVRFVELPDSIPVQGPETEVVDRMVFGDFMTLLNEKERQIVVLLSRGYTRLDDIAAKMGYATHSPVSKKLAKIRTQAAAYFDQRP